MSITYGINGKQYMAEGSPEEHFELMKLIRLDASLKGQKTATGIMQEDIPPTTSHM